MAKKKATKRIAKVSRPIVKQAAFLAAYSNCGNISKSAQLAGVHRDQHYYWLNKDPKYREKFQAAHEQAIDSLEAEARRRAVEGVNRPVFHQGMQCGVIREFSDTLLIFLLKGARPEKYRDNSRIQVDGNLNHTGEVGVQIYIPENGRD